MKDVADIEDDTVIRALADAADRHGDAPLLRMDGAVISYAQALEHVTAVATGLIDLGVAPGDRVAVMSDNRQEAVWAWLGTNAAAAIDVPLNTAAQGSFLQHQLMSARPRVAIGTADYLARMMAAPDCGIELAVIIGDVGDPLDLPSSIRSVSFDELVGIGRSRSLDSPLSPKASSTATILYTSGTTGPSKGVMIPQRYYSVWGRRARSYLDVRPDDVIYCVQPLFHVDARAYIQNALFSGATAAIGTRFSASNFWDEVRHHEATVFSYIGTMLWLLYKQPESDADRDHAVRIAGGAATPAEIHRAFEQRFGVQLREAYGMTESLFLAHADRSTPVGSVGRLVPEVEGFLADDAGQAVPPGEAGELLIRPTVASCTAQGYWPEGTGVGSGTDSAWFHTGDLLREDAEGNLFFVGRTKDSIRRRGENVSAWEVEEAAMKHPDVVDVAVIGVPSPLGEEDVALLARLREGALIDPPGLRDFVAGELPRFAVPRFVEFVDDFPKTPSERVDKGKVRERGISERAWDAEAPTVP